MTLLKAALAHPAWTDDPTCAWFKPWAGYIGASGLDYVRFDINYQDANAVAKTQAIVSMLQANHLQAIVSLGGSGQNWTAPDPEAFATVAGQVARTLPMGAVLEIWNEPNQVPQFWPANDPVAYAKLAQVTYSAVKAEAQQTLISAPNSAFADQTFLNKFLTLVPESFDLLSIHPYTVGLSACPDDPDTAHNGWQSFTGTIAMAKQQLELVGRPATLINIGEVGWPVADPGPSHYRAAVQLARNAGAFIFSAYNIGDHPAEQNAYSLFNPDGSQTLALKAFVNA